MSTNIQHRRCFEQGRKDALRGLSCYLTRYADPDKLEAWVAGYEAALATCEWCGQSVPRMRTDQRFCGEVCRAKARGK